MYYESWKKRSKAKLAQIALQVLQNQHNFYFTYCSFMAPYTFLHVELLRVDERSVMFFSM